jgi:hypothetical protein
MSEKFLRNESPFSEETKKLRRNTVFLSGVCLFIGITEQFPTKFALLGMSFESGEQQATLGWFLLFITLYSFMHFVAVTGIEVAKWVHPLYTYTIAKEKLLEHPAFDEEDFHYLADPFEISEDKNEIAKVVHQQSKWQAEKKLRYLYNGSVVRIILELLAPAVLFASGVSTLMMLILSIRNTL